MYTFLLYELKKFKRNFETLNKQNKKGNKEMNLNISIQTEWESSEILLNNNVFLW